MPGGAFHADPERRDEMRKRRKSMRDVEKFEARQFIEAGMAVRGCADYFDVSLATLMRGLAEMRAKFGPEKRPAHRRHLARLRIENSAFVEDITSNT